MSSLVEILAQISLNGAVWMLSAVIQRLCAVLLLWCSAAHSSQLGRVGAALWLRSATVWEPLFQSVPKILNFAKFIAQCRQELPQKAPVLLCELQECSQGCK